MTTMMVTLLLSSLLVGFAVMVGADNQLANMDIGSTDAFYLSQAGLEKMTSDLGSLFIADTTPTGDQVRSIGDVPPVLDDVTFLAPDGGDGYTITFPTTTGNPLTGDPVTQVQTVSSGPFQGLIGLVTPYALEVTARKSDGAEATLRRSVQTASVPIWEFGLYSERDLIFFPGPPFSVLRDGPYQRRPLCHDRLRADDVRRPGLGARPGRPARDAQRLRYDGVGGGYPCLDRAGGVPQSRDERGQCRHQRQLEPE